MNGKRYKIKLILSSCDFGHPESAKFIYNHLPKSAENCRILFFPNEKATESTIKSGKYETRLSILGFQKKNIYVADYFNPAPYCDLDIDAIYISGGNPFGTMKRIRESGLDKAIINYVQNGVLYIGGSAGAHIASANLSHVAKYDTDTFGLIDFSGLALFRGILICHYTEERKEDRLSLIADGKYTVKALKDGESILIREE